MKYTKKDVKSTLLSIIDGLSNYTIDCERDFNENGINSILLVKIYVRLEEIYEIEFEENDFDNDRFTSINEFIDYLTDKVNKTE